jgi:protein-tyrosine-phosphatase
VAATKKSFCVVCIANYCRSPVAENLLKKRFRDKYEFLSAGISPLSSPSMDPRSLKFLKENNCNHNFHTPKKISKKMLSYFDKFLAVDLFVLNHLNVAYPKYKHKFQLLSIQFNDINIIDPYHFQIDEYMKVMNDIMHISNKINLEEM